MSKRSDSATDTVMPKRNLLSQEEWNEMYDAIELAKDALGDSPADVDANFLVNNVMHLRRALTLAHKKARDTGALVC